MKRTQRDIAKRLDMADRMLEKAPMILGDDYRKRFVIKWNREKACAEACVRCPFINQTCKDGCEFI